MPSGFLEKFLAKIKLLPDAAAEGSDAYRLKTDLERIIALTDACREKDTLEEAERNEISNALASLINNAEAFRSGVKNSQDIKEDSLLDAYSYTQAAGPLLDCCLENIKAGRSVKESLADYSWMAKLFKEQVPETGHAEELAAANYDDADIGHVIDDYNNALQAYKASLTGSISVMTEDTLTPVQTMDYRLGFVNEFVQERSALKDVPVCGNLRVSYEALFTTMNTHSLNDLKTISVVSKDYFGKVDHNFDITEESGYLNNHKLPEGLKEQIIGVYKTVMTKQSQKLPDGSKLRFRSGLSENQQLLFEKISGAISWNAALQKALEDDGEKDILPGGFAEKLYNEVKAYNKKLLDYKNGVANALKPGKDDVLKLLELMESTVKKQSDDLIFANDTINQVVCDIMTSNDAIGNVFSSLRPRTESFRKAFNERALKDRDFRLKSLYKAPFKTKQEQIAFLNTAFSLSEFYTKGVMSIDEYYKDQLAVMAMNPAYRDYVIAKCEEVITNCMNSNNGIFLGMDNRLFIITTRKDVRFSHPEMLDKIYKVYLMGSVLRNEQQKADTLKKSGAASKDIADNIDPALSDFRRPVNLKTTKDVKAFCTELSKLPIMRRLKHIEPKEFLRFVAKEKTLSELSVPESGIVPEASLGGYVSRLAYIQDRFERALKGTSNPMAAKVNNGLKALVSKLADMGEGDIAAEQLMEYFNNSSLKNDVDQFMEELSRKDVLSTAEQQQLKAVSRFNLTKKQLQQNVYSPEEDRLEILAEKIAAASAVDGIENPHLIETFDGMSIPSFEYGHMLLTNKYEMDLMTTSILESRSFRKITEGKSPEYIDKLIHAESKDLLKGFRKVLYTPSMMAKEQKNFGISPQSTAYGGIKVSAYEKESLQANAISEFIDFTENPDGTYRACYKFPDKAKREDKVIDIRKNINIVMKHIALMCFDDNGYPDFARIKTVEQMWENCQRGNSPAENIINDFGIKGINTEDFGLFIKHYSNKVLDDIVQGFFAEAEDMRDYQQILNYSNTLDPRDPAVDGFLEDSYLDYRRKIDDFLALRDIVPEKEMRIMAYLDCRESSRLCERIAADVSRYAAGIGKTGLNSETVVIDMSDMQADPAHDVTPAFDCHYCFGANVEYKDGSKHFVSLEMTAPPSGRLLYRDPNGRSALGIFDEKKDLISFHRGNNLIQVKNIDKYSNILNVDKNKDITAVGKPAQLTGSYRFDMKCRQQLRTTPHTYYSLKERLGSGTVDSKVIRSSPQFRKLKTTFEALGCVKNQAESDRLMAKLQKEAADYLEYKDPKGNISKQKDFSDYAMTRIKFVRDVYEYTSVQINKKADYRHVIAEKLVHGICGSLMQHGTAEQKNFAGRVRTIPAVFEEMTQKAMNDNTFKAITENKNIRSLMIMANMSNESFYEKYRQVHNADPELSKQNLAEAAAYTR